VKYTFIDDVFEKTYIFYGFIFLLFFVINNAKIV